MPLKVQSPPPTVINTWKSSLGASGLQSAGTVVVLLIADAFLVMQVLSRAVDLGSFLLALLTFLVTCLLLLQVYTVYSLYNLTYVLGADNLAIKCGALRYVLPLNCIEQVLPLKASVQKVAAKGSFAFGYPDRCATLNGIGEVRLVSSTTDARKLALVTTAGASYILSPDNRDAFVERVNVRRSRVDDQMSSMQVDMPRLARLSFWGDRVALLLLAVGLVANLILLAYVSYRYPSLPPLLPLHYNSLGEIDFIGTRAEAFKIPAIGSVAMLADLIIGAIIHTREKIAAYVLLSTGIAVQVILLVAIVKIVV